MSEYPEVYVRKLPWWPNLWWRWEAKVVDIAPGYGYMTAYADGTNKERAIRKALAKLAKKLDPEAQWTRVEV